MLTKQQEIDGKKCEKMQEKGQDMDCLSCSCNVCIAQENNFTIKELIKKSHENAVNHGFWENWEHVKQERLSRHAESYYNAVGNMLMLIVSELAEAQEGLRHNDMNNFKEELADVAIRLADFCGGLNIDLETEILKKMQKNKNRPYKHGKSF